MNNFDSAYKTVCTLVNDFKSNEKYYLSNKYNETQVRKDYIDKFFEALGWDVNHSEQRNPYKQEVKVEETQVNQRRPDYTFYLEPKFKEPLFFVEAKKPAKNLKDSDYYFQTVRYARFASTPIAVLTDFEEFHILDCRFKPDINSVLLNPNHKRYHYCEYADEKKFAEIYYIFSRESVADKSIEQYAENLPTVKIKGVQASLFKLQQQSLDEEFLEYLDGVREKLAKAFKKNDNSLSSDALTEATQRTIDRLVFIRFLEDKLIEPDDYISKIGLSNNAWGDFVGLCKRLNSKYNGIVFKNHFIDGQNFGGPELNEFTNICLEFSQSNKKGYDYNLIPVHILGSIYERFLGKVVTATEKRVRIEEKPEVRKAGGVYYTPKYIVDYIVSNTIGKLIEGKKPAEISKLKFADIACGSGSFLIGAFDKLLDYHNEYYWNNIEEAKKDGCKFKDNIPVLSIKQKQGILLNNIFGVDIDSQAVEVTQLSLALKMLEDETLATANDMQVLFHEKILPDLTKNIVCGNSLIGTDILEGKMFAGEEERKLNPMDFETVFPHIFKSSPTKLSSPHASGGDLEKNGFDAIIGNPPYGAELSSLMITYFNQKYFYQNYQLDSTFLFLERGIKKLKINGELGFIIPNTWLQNLLSSKIRKFIFEATEVKEIVHYKNKVFDQATVDTEIILLKYNKPVNNKIKILITNKTNIYSSYLIEQLDWIKSSGMPVNIFEKPEYKNISQKIKNNPSLSNFCYITQGCKPFQVGKGKPKQSRKIVDEKPFVSEKKNDNTFKPLLRGSNIQKYLTIWNKNYYISFGDWLAEPRYSANYEMDKIVIRQTGDSLIATFDTNKFIIRDNLYSIVIKNNIKFNILFILGLLNSKLMNWYYQNIVNQEKGEALAQVKRGHISILPIKEINFNIDSEKQSHDLIVSYVDQMLSAKKQFHESKTDKDKTYYERKCESLDRQIDAEVYKLYGLTEEEIKIVENEK